MKMRRLKEDRALGPAGRSPGQSRRAAWVSSSIPSKCGNPRRQRISSRIHTLWPNVASLMRFAIYLWRNPRNASVFPIMPVSRMGLILKPVSFAAPWPCAKVPRLTSLAEDRGNIGSFLLRRPGLDQTAGLSVSKARIAASSAWHEAACLKAIGDISAGDGPTRLLI